MIATIGRTLLAILGLTSIASTALAQGNTFNPYGNSGYADYREFGNPMYSNNPALPGQAVLNNQPLVGRPRSNSFQQYSNDLDGVGSDAAGDRRATSSSLPYYQAYQRLNGDYNRVYRPNATDKDREFYERQRQREVAYAEAMREKDPAKRAKLLRLVQQYSLDQPSTPRPVATKGATATKPAAGGPTTARSAAPTDRRQTAPPPFSSSDPNRRAGTNAPATRAPAPPPIDGESTAPKTPARSGAARTRPAPDPSTIPTPPPR